MMNYNVILEKYNEEERKELVKEMRFASMLGVPAPQTEKELIEWCENVFNRKKELARLEAEKVEKKANKEKAKAEEMGLTVEAYREYKKALANKKRHETEIRKALRTIEEMQKRIKYEEKKVTYYNNVIEKIGIDC